MALKKWVVGKPNREVAKQLATECGIDDFAALIACSRGINEPYELEMMLTDEPILGDPKELVDIQKAADAINTAIDENIRIAVYGDYDCDGVVSTAIMYDYLMSRGADVVTYIPDRLGEGYGMNTGAVDKLKELGVGLIVTVDNGVSCAEEIAYAKKLGIGTVVTDHHIPPEELPDAIAVVDPHRKDCGCVFKEICGAQVAFKTVCVIDDKEPEQLIYRYADLLSVAIIGDIMPLTDENRSIVKMGINIIKTRPNKGISALLSVSGTEKSSVTAGKISFTVVPRINAAGRMGDATRALKLLCCDDIRTAITIANDIDDDNSRRQQIERKVTQEAIDIVEKCGYSHNRVIVVVGDGWHLGLVGIVASRLCEKYGRPAIVMSFDGDLAHGSGRSIAGFNLYNSVNYCKDVLVKYGGHELAAGVTVNSADIDLFRRKINEYSHGCDMAVPTLNIDFRINPAGMSVDMVDDIKSLEPYGMGNPAPVFGIFEVTLEKITPIGSGKHLKLMLKKGDTSFQALLFGVTENQFCFCLGDTVDIAVNLDANYYKETYCLSVVIKAIRLSGIDDEKVFTQLYNFDDFCSGIECDINSLFVSREEVGKVYKYIYKEPVLPERIKYIFHNDLGLAKTSMALKILSELELISQKDGQYVVNASKKTDLLNSPTYKFLSERVK